MFILPDSYIDPVNKEYGGMQISKLTMTNVGGILNVPFLSLNLLLYFVIIRRQIY